jgi:hypothetical protein
MALHEGLEPSATEFRSPCSAVELMERGDETYVGVGLMPLSFAVVINVFFIMPITITQVREMSNTFAKNLCLLAKGVDNEGLSLLLPARRIHLFLGDDVDILVQSHEHHGNALLSQLGCIWGEKLGKDRCHSHLLNRVLHVNVDGENRVGLDVVNVDGHCLGGLRRQCDFARGQEVLVKRLLLFLGLCHLVCLSIQDRCR